MSATIMTGQRRCVGAAGFTLVEMLVALAIFGLIAVAGGYLLRFSLDAQGRTGRSLDRIASVRRISALLTADAAQIVPRMNRDERGDRQAALVGDSQGMRFVRAGWSNEGGGPRSSLQKVSYRLDGQVLVRTSWPLVDGVANDRAVHSRLIVGITHLALRYRNDGAWSSAWHPRLPADLPDAIELTMDVTGIGEIRQLFLVGARR